VAFVVVSLSVLIPTTTNQQGFGDAKLMDLLCDLRVAGRTWELLYVASLDMKARTLTKPPLTA